MKKKKKLKKKKRHWEQSFEVQPGSQVQEPFKLLHGIELWTHEHAGFIYYYLLWGEKEK